MLGKLERRFGRFAIPNLTLVFIIGQVFALFAGLGDPQILERIDGNVAEIFGGEWYRLVTFVWMPPGLHPIWAFFFWYMFYMMGTSLELHWGTFRYNVFLLIGYVSSVAAALLLPGGYLMNGFLQGTVFLAFAWLNPDFIIQIFFVLPVRIKWIALLTWIYYLLIVVFGPMAEKLAAVASVLNFLLFFGKEIWYRARSGQRQMAGQVRRFTEKPAEFLHKCAVCGITDKTHPQMDFRYCSRCANDACYCSEHLRNHEHVQQAN